MQRWICVVTLIDAGEAMRKLIQRLVGYHNVSWSADHQNHETPIYQCHWRILRNISALHWLSGYSDAWNSIVYTQSSRSVGRKAVSHAGWAGWVVATGTASINIRRPSCPYERHVHGRLVRHIRNDKVNRQIESFYSQQVSVTWPGHRTASPRMSPSHLYIDTTRR